MGLFLFAIAATLTAAAAPVDPVQQFASDPTSLLARGWIWAGIAMVLAFIMCILWIAYLLKELKKKEPDLYATKAEHDAQKNEIAEDIEALKKLIRDNQKASDHWREGFDAQLKTVERSLGRIEGAIEQRFPR